MTRSTAIVMTLLLAGLAPACTAPGAGGAPDLTDPAARGSYAQGVSVGQQGRDYPLDVEAFLAGVRAGLEDTSAMSPQEMQQALMDFQMLLNEQRAELAEAGLAEGRAFLEENGQRDGVMTTESGVQYEVLREGAGPRPGAGDRVLVNYRGSTIDGTVFDESYARGEPSDFEVGGVIPGLAEGLQLMPVGSHYKFYIPGPLAYGPNPRPGAAFGPNALLVFEVELLEIQ